MGIFGRSNGPPQIDSYFVPRTAAIEGALGLMGTTDQLQ
jgi:hypothetical protein